MESGALEKILILFFMQKTRKNLLLQKKLFYWYLVYFLVPGWNGPRLNWKPKGAVLIAYIVLIFRKSAYFLFFLKISLKSL